MSDLRNAIDEYLTVRRRLGFKLTGPGYLLADFARYHERMGAAAITSTEVLAWVKQPTGCQPVWWSIRLGVVRRFAIYLHSIDSCHEVPPSDIYPPRSTRATPYLYSEADIGSLMAAARALPNAFRAATYATLIGLLAVTGMRVGEAIRLDCVDADWSGRLLVVRSSKFGKSREVALAPSTVDALRFYDRQRRQLRPRPQTPAFFVSNVGTRLIHGEVDRTFRRLVTELGLDRRRSTARPPRPHDLRHTFAVSTLLMWYQAGVDVGERIHLLSTYMGHTDPANTYWYLSAAPELMALAAERLEHSLGG